VKGGDLDRSAESENLTDPADLLLLPDALFSGRFEKKFYLGTPYQTDHTDNKDRLP
jgi:hypothetical protein